MKSVAALLGSVVTSAALAGGTDLPDLSQVFDNQSCAPMMMVHPGSLSKNLQDMRHVEAVHPNQKYQDVQGILFVDGKKQTIDGFSALEKIGQPAGLGMSFIHATRAVGSDPAKYQTEIYMTGNGQTCRVPEDVWKKMNAIPVADKPSGP